MPTNERLVPMTREQIYAILSQIADDTALLSDAEIIDHWYDAEAQEFAEV